MEENKDIAEFFDPGTPYTPAERLAKLQAIARDPKTPPAAAVAALREHAVQAAMQTEGGLPTPKTREEWVQRLVALLQSCPADVQEAVVREVWESLGMPTE